MPRAMTQGGGDYSDVHARLRRCTAGSVGAQTKSFAGPRAHDCLGKRGTGTDDGPPVDGDGAAAR